MRVAGHPGKGMAYLAREWGWLAFLARGSCGWPSLQGDEGAFAASGGRSTVQEAFPLSASAPHAGSSMSVMFH